jgi:hypothetical protein
MTDAFRIKQSRKRLLTNLNILYPSPITTGELYRTVCHLDPTYDFSLFQKDIIYFSDKGWLEFIDDRLGGFDEFRKKVIKLTAEGKEISEGTKMDKALEI